MDPLKNSATPCMINVYPPHGIKQGCMGTGVLGDVGDWYRYRYAYFFKIGDEGTWRRQFVFKYNLIIYRKFENIMTLNFQNKN